MRVDVPMPVITAAGEDAVVTAWFVDEGAACTEGQLIAEVQAEKVSDEVHATVEGYVVDRVAIGDPVHQGAPICAVVDVVEPRRAAPVPVTAAASTVAPAIKASPSARRTAREIGVELSTVTGTGPDGRITEEDVRDVAAGTAGDRGSLRAVIARNMRRSHAETVPVTLFATAGLGAEIPASLTARVVKAVASALAEHPALNGRRRGDDFVAAVTTDVSLAIQTDEGLVAPVVRDAGAKTVEEIAAAVDDLAERARSKRLTSADYEGGTFSVSNLGGYGIDGFTPVINLPQVAILGVGAARRVPVARPDGSVTTEYQMALSLTFDHAFVDGAPAAEFLGSVRRALLG